MIQIIDEQRPQSGLEKFMQMIGAGMRGGAEGGQSIKQAMGERSERDALSQRFGDIFGKVGPNTRSQLLTGEIQKENQAAKFKQEMTEGMMDYETVKKYAGEDVADFYKAATTGGKTKIIQSIVDSLERGEKFGDMLGGASQSGEPSPEDMPISGMQSEGKLNLPDFTQRPKGFTRADWAKERTGWAKKNTETLETSRDRLRGNKRDILGTKKLQQLNESHELPEGLERFIINPKSGEIYGLAQLAGKAPTAAQEWVKEIARFGNRAKDAYGSRVTNFDLSQYMKQFPSLLNTPEGRKNILRMMEINYELDGLYDRAFQQIIDEKGEGNIPPAQVDKIARGMIKDREEQLFNEYLNIEQENEGAFMKEGLSKPSLEEIFGG
jgi:hypothetical protein